MKYAVSSLMVAVSALAFSANANASDFKPYVGLDLMGYLPLGCDQVFSLVGTMGIGEYTFDKNYSGFYAPKDQRDHGIGYRFGGGLQYKIDDKFSVRGLVRYVNLNDIDNFDDMWEYTAGIRYSF